MKLTCRSIATGPVLLAFLFFALASISAEAAAINDAVPDQTFIAQLEQRALQAKPREQCFLYTELVHSMTQLAGKQFVDGDVEAASATLKKVEHYAELIHMNLAKDTKKLKDAEMLMHHTTVRLGDFLRQASSDDRPVLQATLSRLDHVHDELLTQVFVH